MTTPRILRFPPELTAPGARDTPFRRLAALGDLPEGAMLRVSHGDLDVLVAHASEGLVATDDRCPHMSAPLSLGRLEGCVVDCPLHRGRFDLATGEVAQFPTTGGLDADGAYHPVWAPPGQEPRPEPADSKARARALTRVRRLRFYPLRVVGDDVEVALPD
jgi:nitrite reductase/ring-hydroxylating ferredoxin subunit